MAVTFFIRVRGQILGPFALEALQDLENNGQLADNYEISQDGQSWRQVAVVKHLLQPGRPTPEPAPALPAPPEPAPSPAPLPSGPAAPPLATQPPAPTGGTSPWEVLQDESLPTFPAEASEPWFFRYLEICTRGGMWVGMVLIILLLLAVLFFSAAAFFSQPKNPGETALFLLVGIPSLFLLALFLGLTLVFAASGVMLLLDMGRRLRSLDRKSRRH